MDDFRVTGPSSKGTEGAGYFEVLFDVGPQPPGTGLEYFARGDTSCDANCPDKHYLAQRGVYTTTNDYFTVRHLAPAPGVDVSRGRPDIHDVTIVLLDGTGRRIGESAWSTSFEILHD